MSNRKGLSAVVATVLILLITLSLAAIIAQIIIPFVKDSLKQSTECVPYQTHFSFDSSFGYNCYKIDGNNFVYKISVKAASAESSIDDEIACFNLVIGSDGSSKVMGIKPGITGSCTVGGIRNLENTCPANPGVLIIPKVGEVRSYTYTSDKILKSLEIGSLLFSGRACEVSDSIKQIPPCTIT